MTLTYGQMKLGLEVVESKGWSGTGNLIREAWLKECQDRQFLTLDQIEKAHIDIRLSPQEWMEMGLMPPESGKYPLHACVCGCGRPASRKAQYLSGHSYD